MRRFRVVAFETLFVVWADQVVPRGGGVAFVPLEETDWPATVNAIVRGHFQHRTVRTSELGIATLDESALEQFCRRHVDAFWQGGERV